MCRDNSHRRIEDYVFPYGNPDPENDWVKLPRMAELKRARHELAEKKKALHAEYRQAQRDMRELATAKGNVDHLLGVTGGRDDKEQAR